MSLDFVDAFKRNDSRLFRIAVTAAEFRTLEENETLTSALVEIEDQV